MSTNEHQRILLVDDNHIFRETLAQRLRDAGYQVATAETGERAFLALRDWIHPVDWLYTRAKLPGLIDGTILADEYHDSHADRAAIIAAPESRTSQQGHIILQQPALPAVLNLLMHMIKADLLQMPVARAAMGDQRHAA